VGHQDEMASPGGGTATLGGGTVSSGGGTPNRGGGMPFHPVLAEFNRWRLVLSLSSGSVPEVGFWDP